MTFPTDLTATSSENSNTTSHDVLMPATVVSGQPLGFLFQSDSGNAPTTPTGWTAVASEQSNGHSTVWFEKDTVDGTEGGTTVTVTTSSSDKSAHWSITTNGVAFHISAFDADQDQDAPDSPNLAPGEGVLDFRWYTLVGTDDVGGVSQTITTVPTNYGNSFIVSGTGGGGVSIVGADRELNASSENPGAWLLGFAYDTHAITLAVEPSVVTTATGAASIPAITGSGVATVHKKASGTPSIPALTASGVATVAKKASGAASIPAVEASGVAVSGIRVRSELSSDSGGSQTTSQQFTLPSDVVAGDKLLCVSGFDGSTGTVTGPGGIWTSTRFAAGAGGSDLVVHTATATSGLSNTTVSFTIATARFGSHHCWSVTRGGTITLGSSASGSGDNNPDPPSTTPSGGAISRMWFPIGVFAGNSGTLDVVPTGYADEGISNRGVGSGTDGNVVFSRKVSTNASENPSAYTVSTNFSTISWTALTIAIEETAGEIEASGAPSIPAVESSGVASVRKNASGAPSIPAIESSGVATVTKKASGAADIPVITASGATKVHKVASGAASIPSIVGSGVGLVITTASGTPSIPSITASGTASSDKNASGAPSIPAVTSSGVASVLREASGAPSIPTITSSGVAAVRKSASGAATIPAVAGSGIATTSGSDTATGAASTPVITGTGTGSTAKKASGTPSIPAISAAGVASVIKKASGAPNTPAITASGAATRGGALPHILKFSSGTTTTFTFTAAQRA